MAWMTVVDAVWLVLMVPRVYQPGMKHLMAASPNWIAAVAFYLIYGFCVSTLIISPALQNQSSLMDTFIKGALLGLAAYGTYNLTNLSTLSQWPLSLTLIDLTWGTVMTGTLSAGVLWLLQALKIT